MTARALPEHLRAYLPGGLDVRQVNAWDAPGPDGSRRGTVTMEMLGAPLTLRGTMTLTAEGEGACRLSYAVHLRASVPLVGAVIEEAAAPAIHAGIRAERDQLMARLIEDAGATEPGAA
jgi:hypothetical protein